MRSSWSRDVGAPLGAWIKMAGVELFHLVFLRGLTARLPDKKLVALKGGANLRFYFDSVRYSEAIDFDVTTIQKGTLEKKVDDLLASPLVLRPLAQHGCTLVDVSKPKQTETTQRWKAGLKSDADSLVTRTKVEFSRRGALDGAAFESVSTSVTGAYSLTPFLAMHYLIRNAILHKIHALYDRSEPQPRDVFDLNYLFPRLSGALVLSEEERSWLPAAIDNAMSVSYDDYAAKVATYLEPEHAEVFAPKEQ